MDVIWFKIWSDLWHNKTRTLLAVLSIAAGVFAMGAIFGMSDLMTTNMDASHQSVLPPHIDIGLGTPIDRDTLLSLEDIPGVEGVEPYNSVSVLYKIHPQDAWRQGLIMERGDYEHQKYELVQLREGHWPNNKNEIGVERMAAGYNKLGIGDTIIFKVGNQERTLPITSLIRHPFVPPPMFYDLSVFFMDEEGLQRFDIPEGKYTGFYVRVTPYSTDHAKEVATAIKDKLAKQDIRVTAFLYQDPERHWGRQFMDGFNLVQRVLALICVAMGAILVFNTLSNLITQQTNQIGILKAIGGKAQTIVGVYLVSAFVYGLLALVIALPLGALVAFVVSRYFLDLFNIDFNEFTISRQAVTFQILSALAAPLLAGLPPVLQGAAMSVRQAIASYGLGGNYSPGRIARFIDGIGERWLPSYYATALGNMLRRRGRLIMTELVLLTAGAAFLMVMSLNSSIGLTMDNIFGRQKFDTLIQFAQNERLEQVTALGASVPGIDKAELHLIQAASMFVSGQLVKEAGIGTNIEGMPSDSDFYKPLIVSGRWLNPGDGRVVVLTRDSAEKNNIHVGDIVTLDLGELGEDQWQVIGLYDPVFTGGFASDTIYAPLDELYQVTKKYNQGALLYIRTTSHDAVFTDTLTTRLKNLYEDRGLKVASSQTQSAQRTSNEFQFSIVVTMMMGLSVIVAIVGGIALMGALSIGVIERTKEIGVLRAVGARSRTILGIFMMEGLLQGGLSWLLAVPLSWIASPILASGLGKAMFGAALDYRYNWVAVGIWFVIIMVISAAASFMPARGATRISVRDSLAYA